MQTHIEGIRQAADDRIALERNEARKLTEVAAEVFAEGELKDKTIAEAHVREQQLQSDLAHAQGALQEAQDTISALRKEIEQLRKDRDQVLTDVAKAQASADTIRKLVPFLDPKHLPTVLTKGGR
ncbi:MAG: hypothetical protein Q4E62_10270 [Sutterellaceae bacterium]|nr:hypothetical protein [Sutterellaceae bacterium]